jgi:hypothetical protein
MDDTLAFLNACLDEDEARAKRIGSGNMTVAYNMGPSASGPGVGMGGGGGSSYITGVGSQLLREVAAKRKILAIHQAEPGQHPGFCGHDLREMPCPTITILAAVYSDKPGFKEKWNA